MSTPMKTIPADWSCIHVFCMKGASAPQGSQDDCQKFNTTTLPLKSARCTIVLLLLSTGSAKAGAGLPINELLTSPGATRALECEPDGFAAGVSNAKTSTASSPPLIMVAAMKIVIRRLDERFAGPADSVLSSVTPCVSIYSAPLPE